MRRTLASILWLLALFVGGAAAALGVTHLLAQIGRRVDDDVIDGLIKERGAK